MKKKDAPILGVLRLDYDYPPALGDVDDPDTFEYDVLFRVVPELTFNMCQSGDISEKVKANVIEAVQFLAANRVCGITGDCGFMLNIQSLAAQHTNKPVFLSCLVQLPSIIHSIADDAEVAIFTANSNSLLEIEAELDRLCMLKDHSHRLRIVGCQQVQGFDAVAKGQRVDKKRVGPGVMRLAIEFLRKNPKVECILLECTELPPYANAIRNATGLPVYDSVTNCDSFMSGFLNRRNFGLQDWQKEWDGTHASYRFGDNLSDTEKRTLRTKD